MCLLWLVLTLCFVLLFSDSDANKLETSNAVPNFYDTNNEESSDSDIVESLCSIQDSKVMINNTMEIVSKLVLI